MNTTKTQAVLSCCLLALFFLFSTKTYGVNIHILGKAGATIQKCKIVRIDPQILQEEEPDEIHGNQIDFMIY